MTLTEAIDLAKQAGLSNVPDIIRYLTRRPTETTLSTVDTAKPAEQVQAEQAAKTTLAGLITLLQPDADVPATITTAQKSTWAQFVGWIKPRLAALSDIEQRQAQVAFAELTAAYLGHQNSGYKWTSPTWGEATEPREVTTVTEGESLAELHNLDVNYRTVKQILKEVK